MTFALCGSNSSLQSCIRARLSQGYRILLLLESDLWDVIQNTFSDVPSDQLYYSSAPSEWGNLSKVLSQSSPWTRTHFVIGALTDISKLDLHEQSLRYSEFSFCFHVTEPQSNESQPPRHPLFVAPPTERTSEGAVRRFSVSAEHIDLCLLKNTPSKTEKPKSEETKKLLHLTLKLIPFFSGFEICQMMPFLTRRDTQAGEVIVKQHDWGDDMFIIESGIFQVSIDGKVVAMLPPPAYFGELSLFYSCPRAASVSQMNPNGILWVLNRSYFRGVIQESILKPWKNCMSFLEQVPFLQNCPKFSLNKLIDRCTFHSFDPGQRIDSDKACIHIVKYGELVVYMSDDSFSTISEGGIFVFGKHLSHSAIISWFNNSYGGSNISPVVVHTTSGNRGATICCIPKEDFILSW